MLESIGNYVSWVARGAGSVFYSAAASNRVSRMAYYLHELLLSKQHPCPPEIRGNLSFMQWQFDNGRIADDDYQTYCKALLGGMVYSMVCLDSNAPDSELGRRYAVDGVEDIVIQSIEVNHALALKTQDSAKGRHRELLLFGIKINDIGSQILKKKIPFVRGEVLDKYFPGVANMVSKSAFKACQESFEVFVHNTGGESQPKPASVWERLYSWGACSSFSAVAKESDAAKLAEYLHSRIIAKDSDACPRQLRDMLSLMRWQFEKDRIADEDTETYVKVLLGSIVNCMMLLDKSSNSSDAERLYPTDGVEAATLRKIENDLGVAANDSSNNGDRHRKRLLFSLKSYDLGEQVLNGKIPFVQSKVLDKYFPGIKEAVSKIAMQACGKDISALTQGADELAERNARGFLQRWFG